MPLDSDVQRAADRATILEKLGRPVVPVVAGRQINAEAVALAQHRSVSQVLDGALIAASEDPRP